MSLVNKMLRDLDARRAAEGERSALPVAVTPLAARREPRPVWPWLALGALVGALVLGGLAWFLRDAAPSAPSPTATARAPAPAAPAPEIVVAPPSGANAVPQSKAPDLSAAPAAQSAAPQVNAVSSSAGLRLSEELHRLPEGRRSQASPPAATRAATKAAAEKPAATRPEGAAMPAPPSGPAAVIHVPSAAKATPSIVAEGRVEKLERKPPPAEAAEAHLRRAQAAQRQGNLPLAIAAYRAALDDYPEHPAARQALAGLLIEGRRFDDAEDVLRRGIEIAGVRLASTLALARLKVERGDAGAALELLQRQAAAGEQSAEYQGFLGALLNRGGRSAEAVERYRSAARLAPGEARWWAGLGIALEAAGNAAEARDAYQKARVLPGLAPDLAQHVEQRLR